MRQIKVVQTIGFLLTILFVFYQSCDHVEGKSNISLSMSQQFKDYWHQGLAELNHFRLEQVRYGEVHEGNATQIFVTEDFLVDAQVKKERINIENQSIPILKLNFTRKFFTGIYPYSLMTSVFHPLSDPYDKPFKITTSVQEWCGQTYMQLNNRNNKYLISLNSYFESEADKQIEIEHALLEDDVWIKIRLNPEMLTEGEFKMVPGMQYLRLLHQPFNERDVKITKKQIMRSELSSEPLIEYCIDYKDLTRTLTIIFTQNFPHEILYWEEKTSPIRLKGRGKDLMVTRATRIRSVMLDYWNKNARADSTFRYLLGNK